MNSRFRIVLASLVAAALAAGSVTAADGPKPPAKPADITISVSPSSVEPGQVATVHLDLAPIEGVKLNRYPKVKLQVAGLEGLIGDGEATVGNDSPPPLDKMKTNYFDAFDGLDLDLTVDGAARSGRHEVEGKLTYFYCMPASGFCAPKRVSVKIPLDVR
jgi:hypothetical protein